MARAKYLSLKEAREQDRIEEYARQHEIPLEQHKVLSADLTVPLTAAPRV